MRKLSPRWNYPRVAWNHDGVRASIWFNWCWRAIPPVCICLRCAAVCAFKAAAGHEERQTLYVYTSVWMCWVGLYCSPQIKERIANRRCEISSVSHIWMLIFRFMVLLFVSYCVNAAAPIYTPSVWTLCLSACRFEGPPPAKKAQLLWLVSSFRPEQAPPTVLQQSWRFVPTQFSEN